MNNQKKISLVEALLMVLLNLFADIVDIVFNFLALIPAIGVVMFLMAPIISFSVFAITEFWLIMKGGMGFRKQISIIAGNILDVIPLLSFLPIKTAGVLIAIYMINHPEIGKVASMATGKIPLKTAAAAE
ncbi:MAG: hypothetical protein WC461_01130 [Candidatus Paceibacterota bacterium]